MHAGRAADPRPLGDRPLAVIIPGRRDGPPPGVSDEEWARLSEEKLRQKEGLAGLSRNGRVVRAPRSGHHVHLDEPAVVVGVIREVVEAARTRGRPSGPGTAPGAPEAKPQTAGPVESPGLAALLKDLEAGRRDATERFLKDLAGRAPLVEPIPGDEEACRVTYVWRGDASTERVALVGGVPIAAMKELSRLPGTGLWYWTERTPRDGRFSYGFLVNPRRGTPAKVRLDPLGARTYADQSIAELPGAPGQPWSSPRPGVPAGRREAFTIDSVALGAGRRVVVYTPPGYDPAGAEDDMLVVFDGEATGGDLEGDNPIPVPTILDNLIAAKRLAPAVAVFVDSGATRDRDLGCHPPFAEFVATELVPWARARYRVARDPKRATVAGFSRGGLGAAYCARQHPEVFGNVLALSGAFWWYPEADADATRKPPVREIDRETGWLTRQFATGAPVAVRFYLEAGRFEVGLGGGIRAETRRIRDVLEAKGCSVIYREHTGGHDYAAWRGTFADGLLALSAR
jgi:enterochelin esterase-like enzyme